MTQDAYDPNPSAHRDLHLVALFELAKGVVSATVASALALFGPQAVHDFIARVGTLLHFDPEHSAMARLLAAITSDTVMLATAVITTYACLRFILFWGLWRAKAWASWFGAGAAALYLPFCSFALLRYPGWPTAAVLALNVLIVFILIRDLLKRSRAAKTWVLSQS